MFPDGVITDDQPMSSCFLCSLQSTPLTPECAETRDLRPLLTALLIIQGYQVFSVVDQVLFYLSAVLGGVLTCLLWLPLVFFSM